MDCRTCNFSRMDGFRGIRYCTKSGDYCHGESDNTEQKMDHERYNKMVPDSGNCPGCEMVRGLRQYD